MIEIDYIELIKIGFFNGSIIFFSTSLISYAIRLGINLLRGFN